MAAEIGALKYFEICATDPASSKTFYVEAARMALSSSKHKNPEPQIRGKHVPPMRKHLVQRMPLADTSTLSQSQKTRPKPPFSPPSHFTSSYLPPPPVAPLSKPQQQQQQQQQLQLRGKQAKELHRNGVCYDSSSSNSNNNNNSSSSSSSSIASPKMGAQKLPPKFVSEPVLPFISSPSESPSPPPPPVESSSSSSELNMERDQTNANSQGQTVVKPIWSCGKTDKFRQKISHNKQLFFTAKKPDEIKPVVKERRSQSHNFGDGNSSSSSSISISKNENDGSLVASTPSDGSEDDARSLSFPMSPAFKIESRMDESAREADIKPLSFDENVNGKKMGRRTKRRERMEEISALTKGNLTNIDLQQILIEQSQIDPQSQGVQSLPQTPKSHQVADTQEINSPLTKEIQSPPMKEMQSPRQTFQTQEVHSPPQVFQVQEPLQQQQQQPPQMNYQLNSSHQSTDSPKKIRPPTSILYPGEFQQTVGSGLTGVSHGARAKSVHFNVWVYRNVPLSPLIADIWEQSNEFCVLKLRSQVQKCVFSFCSEHGRTLWSVNVSQDALLAVEDSTRFFVLNVTPPIGLGFCTREESNAFVIEFMKKTYESKNANGRKKIIPFLKSAFKKDDSKDPSSQVSSSSSSITSSNSNSSVYTSDVDPVIISTNETKEFEVFHKLENKFVSANGDNSLSSSSSSSSSSLSSSATPQSALPLKTKPVYRHLVIGHQVQMNMRGGYDDVTGLESGERDDPNVIISGEDRRRAIEAVKEFSTELCETIERSKKRVPEIKAEYKANLEAETTKDKMYSKLAVERVRTRLNLEIKK